MTGATPHLVLVLGVHRSGTSLMTAGLQALGCDMGHFAAPSNDENPKGFFEHPAPRALNDRLMAAQGTSWSNWAYDATADGLEALIAWQDEAAAILRDSFQGPGPFVLKDPRISTLLPFWEATLSRMGWRVSRVLLLRDPAEVAESQARRAAANPDFHAMLRHGEGMAALWATTMRTVLASLPDDRTLLVGTERLRARPEATLRECADFLGIAPPAGVVEGFARDFLDPSLHRARGGAEPGPGWPALAAALFQALRPGATPRPLPQAEARQVLRGQPQLGTLLPFLPPMARSLDDAAGALATARAEAAALHALLDTLSGTIGQGPAMPATAEALAALAPLRQERPDDPALLALEARLRERLGELAAAEALWRRLAALRPASPLPSAALARLRRRARRQPARRSAGRRG
ncbi:sulfotransferase family protein [Roseococcus thiosulfatophilus]|uniref:sulfotransferase family protein n=1 Tax=Roseococcus thiosulfatophilus TaxID=35813 RepID=UPI001A8FC289|nr:sulfotransferase [Roseococcus thiosulfatophilus]